MRHALRYRAPPAPYYAAGKKQAVRDAVMKVTGGTRRIYLFEATSREDSSLQYVFCEPQLEALLPAYSRHCHNTDPVSDAYGTANDVAVQRVRPTDIASDGFRRRFFQQAGIIERVSIIQRGADTWRATWRVTSRPACLPTAKSMRSLASLSWLCLCSCSIGTVPKRAYRWRLIWNVGCATCFQA